MRPLTKWEMFRNRFRYGQWSWWTLRITRRQLVIGKFKIILQK